MVAKKLLVFSYNNNFNKRLLSDLGTAIAVVSNRSSFL